MELKYIGVESNSLKSSELIIELFKDIGINCTGVSPLEKGFYYITSGNALCCDAQMRYANVQIVEVEKLIKIFKKSGVVVENGFASKLAKELIDITQNSDPTKLEKALIAKIKKAFKFTELTREYQKEVEKNQNLIRKIDQESFQRAYWRKELENIIGEEAMKEHYKILDKKYLNHLKSKK